MRVGNLGSGLRGGKLGTIVARAGHEVVFSYARSERKPVIPAHRLVLVKHNPGHSNSDHKGGRR